MGWPGAYPVEVVALSSTASRARTSGFSLGAHPDVGLKLARERRDEARRLLADGVDPGEHRKAHKHARADAVSEQLLEAVAREAAARCSPTYTSDHADKIIKRFERDVFPLDGKPVADLNAPEAHARMPASTGHSIRATTPAGSTLSPKAEHPL